MDLDDARSFGIESDYFRDATIVSTPRNMPQSRALRNSSASADASARKEPSFGMRLRSSSRDPEDDVTLVRQPPKRPQIQTPKQTILPSVEESPPSRAVARRVTTTFTEHQEPPKEVSNDDDDEDEEEEEEEEENEPASSDSEDEILSPPRGTGANANTPGRTTLFREAASAQPQPQQNLLELKTRNGVGTTASAGSSRQALQGPAHAAGRHDFDSPAGSSSPGRWLSGPTAATNLPSLFAQAKQLASSPFRGRARYPSDSSERDAAIQRDIRLAEAQYGRQQDRTTSAPAQPWQWLESFTPRSRNQVPQDVQIGDVDENAGRQRFRFMQLLNPLTYLEAVAWFLEAMIVCLLNSAQTSWKSMASVFPYFPHLLSLMLTCLLAFALATHVSTTPESDLIVDYTRQAVGDVGVKIGRAWASIPVPHVPVGKLVPSISWGSHERWADFSDLWRNDSVSTAKVEEFLDRMEAEFVKLRKAGKLQASSLKKLEAVVPKLVHMELIDGQPVIAHEFWHALRDLIQTDGTMLTFDRKGGEYHVSSEEQWKSMASRLASDPAFTTKLNLTLNKVEDRLSSKMTAFWGTWVKDNDDKISQMLGSAVDQVKWAGSQREFDERLRKIVKEQQGTQNIPPGQVVSRDEFLRHLKNEFSAHRAEIRAELNELQPQLQQLVQQTVELATKDIPHGISRGDVITLVNGLIRQSLADMNLEAMASGKIHQHWDRELKNNVNYFAVGAGAIIDGRLSSPAFDPSRKGVAIFSRNSPYIVPGSKPLPPIAALHPWQDEGECFCAARSVNHRGNPHGASLAVQLGFRIIPEHIVVEHILPGATTQPDARPKDIQVYADIPDPTVRQRVRAFAAIYFPDNTDDWNFTPPDYPARYVKISQFRYEGAEIHGGVHVHKLSSELATLGAATDEVIVRAVSNYGAKNHTCFYRVRLYGHNIEGGTPSGSPSDWS